MNDRYNITYSYDDEIYKYEIGYDELMSIIDNKYKEILVIFKYYCMNGSHRHELLLYDHEKKKSADDYINEYEEYFCMCGFDIFMNHDTHIIKLFN